MLKSKILICACSTLISACVIDPTGMVIGAGQKIAQEIRENNIIGKPQKIRNILIGYSEKNDISNKDLKKVKNFLGSKLKVIQKEANKFQGKYCGHESALSEKINVELIKDIYPQAYASREELTIGFTLGYLMNIAYDRNLSENITLPSSESDDGTLWGKGFGFLENRVNLEFQKIFDNIDIIDFQEATLFSLAHEFTHLWLDGSQACGSLEQDIEARADAFGVVLSMSVSPAVNRQAELNAQFSRTLSLSLSDPLDITLYSAEYGASTVFNVYEKYCFENSCNSEVDTDHLPIEVRLEKTSEIGSEILSSEVAKISESEIIKNQIARLIKDGLLGHR